MNDRRRWLGALLLPLALGVLGMPQVASAHPTVMNVSWMTPGSHAGFCSYAQVQQEHVWHSNTTWATDCNYPKKTSHAQYEEFYKTTSIGTAGTYCFNNGWFVEDNTQFMDRTYKWDPGNWCNYGVPMQWYITIDSWHYNYENATVGYVGGARRPATWHLH